VCDNGTLRIVLQTSSSGMHMNSKVGEQHANYELNTQICNMQITECVELKIVPFLGIKDQEKWTVFASFLHGFA